MLHNLEISKVSDYYESIREADGTVSQTGFGRGDVFLDAYGQSREKTDFISFPQIKDGSSRYVAITF